MKLGFRHAFALAAGLLLAPLPAVSLAQTEAQPPLPAVRLNAGIHVIQAEVAASADERATGLMFRQTMAANAGMLFVFPAPFAHCFWMRNTLLPLSIAFIADDGTVVNIADMQPQTTDSHCAEKPVRYALEMNKGWFAKRGIRPGTRLHGGPFES
ncbi:MAG: DUF192 domain-containing protein [Rhizobacter sp.]|nr:DUF192 domain-containing protein [Rhizobacter sp.]